MVLELTTEGDGLFVCGTGLPLTSDDELGTTLEALAGVSVKATGRALIVVEACTTAARNGSYVSLEEAEGFVFVEESIEESDRKLSLGRVEVSCLVLKAILDPEEAVVEFRDQPSEGCGEDIAYFCEDADR